MTSVNFNVNDKLWQQFRTAIFKRKGLKRGDITNALEEAITMWIDKGT